MDMLSRAFIFFGGILIAVGLVWHFTAGNIPLGRLPGDIFIQRGNSKIYFPITTGIVLSFLLTVLGLFFRR